MYVILCDICKQRIGNQNTAFKIQRCTNSDGVLITPLGKQQFEATLCESCANHDLLPMFSLEGS